MSKKFVISAEIIGVEKYVSELVPAPNGKRAVGNYTMAKEEALQYDDEDAAYQVIQKIHNLQDRDFTIQPFTPNDGRGRKELQTFDKSLK